MEKKFAEQVVNELNKVAGPKLSMLEAMSMELVKSDSYDIYAVQKGTITFLAMVTRDMRVTVKLIGW